MIQKNVIKPYMKKIFYYIAVLLAAGAVMQGPAAAQDKPAFKAVVMAEAGGHHIAFSRAARVWLDSLAEKNNFTADYISNTDKIDEAFLKQYQLIIQLDYAPYGWPDKAYAAFEKYITEGWGGWIGFHHATLLGDFDGYKMWPWFHQFMGGIKFLNYIPKFAQGKVNVEMPSHPVMKNVPRSFIVKTEEWYTYDRSPRPDVQVLASVGESSYVPPSDVRMGDHPVVWSNPHYKARNIYIFMGHSPDLLENEAWKTLFTNALFWAAGK